MNEYKKDVRLYEIFEDIANSKDKEEASEKFKKYRTSLNDRERRGLFDILKGALDTSIVWRLPTGQPPFQNADETHFPTNLFKAIGDGKLLYFLDGSNRCIENKLKRERVYIQLLEGVHPKDAKILVDMINKEINYKFVNVTVCRMAFGDEFFPMDRKK